MVLLTKLADSVCNFPYLISLENKQVSPKGTKCHFFFFFQFLLLIYTIIRILNWHYSHSLLFNHFTFMQIGIWMLDKLATLNLADKGLLDHGYAKKWFIIERFLLIKPLLRKVSRLNEIVQGSRLLLPPKTSFMIPLNLKEYYNLEVYLPTYQQPS